MRYLLAQNLRGSLPFYVHAEHLLSAVLSKATKFSPQIKVDVLTDKDDNLLLELASTSAADFLITGNTNDFSIDHFEGTKIVNPRDYWEKYAPK